MRSCSRYRRRGTAETFSPLIASPGVGRISMPTKSTKKAATRDKRQGKSASTQAGEYVHEKMHKLKHGGGSAKNRKQAIAIGLAEARREGVNIPDKSSKKKSSAKKKSSSKRSSTKRSSTKRS